MGFAATASFFEARAGKARDLDDRERLHRVAEFYRRLAHITPDFPPGFKTARPNGADRWKARSDECRAIADHLADPQCHEQMMRLADSYDQLAIAAE